MKAKKTRTGMKATKVMRGGDGDILPGKSNKSLYVPSQTVRSRKKTPPKLPTRAYQMGKKTSDYNPYEVVNQGNTNAYTNAAELIKKEPLYETINKGNESPYASINNETSGDSEYSEPKSNIPVKTRRATNKLPPIPTNHSATKGNSQTNPMDHIYESVGKELTQGEKEKVKEVTEFCKSCLNCRNNNNNNCKMCKDEDIVEGCNEILNPTYTNTNKGRIVVDLSKKIIELRKNQDANDLYSIDIKVVGKINNNGSYLFQEKDETTI